MWLVVSADNETDWEQETSQEALVSPVLTENKLLSYACCMYVCMYVCNS